MARLGEQLIAAGTVTADKVEQALRAQVVWGGRLGTNLIELGCLDLDELSRALGQQHGIPAALARHFEKADPELQSAWPAELAKRFSVVPLVWLSPERIAVVALDPLGTDALAELAATYRVDAHTGIVISVAAEMRVLYHLERVYQIPRAARYLRSKGATVTTFPDFDLSFELDVEVEPEIVGDLAPIGDEIALDLDAPEPAPEPRTRAARPSVPMDEAAALLDRAIEATPTPAAPAGAPVGRERRTYLRTLADDVPAGQPTTARVIQIPPKAPPKVAPPPPTAPPTAPPPPDAPTLQAPSFDAPTVSAPAATAAALRADAESADESKAALGRIALRRVALAPTPVLQEKAPTNFVEATRAIKRGPHRDRVAELVIETLDSYVPVCAAALLLVIRGGVAIGWKHFSRAGDGTSDVAVPLDQDGIVPTVISRNVAVRCPAEDLGALDLLLLRAVGNGDGSDLVVVPIAIGDQVMCLLAAAAESGSEVAPLETVASAAGTAFARLIRDASR